jgi:hypothetical protein
MNILSILILGPTFRFGLWSLIFVFLTTKRIFNLDSYRILNQKIYHTRPFRFWCPNSVIGLWGLIFTFFNHNSVYFLHLYKILDWCITRSYWFWTSKSLFVPWRLFFAFLTLKSIFFLLRIKFPIDRHTRQTKLWYPRSNTENYIENNNSKNNNL